MKMTEEKKKEIDNFTVGKLASLFRFFPSDYTTGEIGKYVQEKIREKVRAGNGQHRDTQAVQLRKKMF